MTVLLVLSLLATPAPPDPADGAGQEMSTPPLPEPETDAPLAEPRPLDSREHAAKLLELNDRIRKTDVHWPRGPVLLAYVGAIGLYVSTLILIMDATSGGLAPRSVIPLSISAAVTGTGLGLGYYFASRARAERDELIQQRDELERTRPEAAPRVERIAPFRGASFALRF